MRSKPADSENDEAGNPTAGSQIGFERGKQALGSAGSALICQLISEQTEGRESPALGSVYCEIQLSPLPTLVKIRSQSSVCCLPLAASVDKDGVSFTVCVLERWAVFMVLHTGVTVATGAWVALPFPQHSFSFCSPNIQYIRDS